MLTVESALTQPNGILSLTVASSPASIPLWITETERLRSQLPPEVQETLLQHEANGTTDDPAYAETMSETHIIGHLKNWDITSRLDSIWIPSLLTAGRYDEFTPTQATVVYKSIPDCTWVLFEHGSHMPHAEETEHYLEVLNDLLTRIEVQD